VTGFFIALFKPSPGHNIHPQAGLSLLNKHTC